MTTTTTMSEARAAFGKLNHRNVADHLGLLGVPAKNCVSHQDYSIGYFDDHSILIWARGEGLVVLDDERTYYRDTVEHLARCLAAFTRERRAGMVEKACGENDHCWIDGICWGKDGRFVRF